MKKATKSCNEFALKHKLLPVSKTISIYFKLQSDDRLNGGRCLLTLGQANPCSLVENIFNIQKRSSRGINLLCVRKKYVFRLNMLKAKLVGSPSSNNDARR